MPVANESYTTVDKSTWEDGPWQHEPDKMVWVDPETDLDCMIVRNGVGSLCGYVGVPEGHPWFGLDYSSKVCDVDTCDEDEDVYWCSHRVDSLLDAHGGITFAGGCREDGVREESICHIAQPGRPSEVWWFGFDCAHAGDFCPGMDARYPAHLKYPRIGGERYRDVPYVANEVASLAKQLLEVASR